MDWLPDYQTIHSGAGCVDLGQRTHVEMGGRDALQVLHGLCSNDILGLQTGQGCEAFVCNVQGKTVGHIWVYRTAEGCLIDTTPGQGELLISHLDRYVIREDVTFADRSQSWHDWLICGPQSPEVIKRLFPSLPQPFGSDGPQHAAVKAAAGAAQLRSAAWVSEPSFLLTGGVDQREGWQLLLRESGAKPVAPEALEAARIEFGLPWFGRDISADNLPQEVGRNEQAISLQKGCYLGQETVARIDAMGHVNRHLTGVRFDGQAVPPAGAELTADGKLVGRVCSATYSPHLQAPLALAYLRRGRQEPGAQLQWEGGSAEVVALPVR